MKPEVCHYDGVPMELLKHRIRAYFEEVFTYKCPSCTCEWVVRIERTAAGRHPVEIKKKGLAYRKAQAAKGQVA